MSFSKKDPKYYVFSAWMLGYLAAGFASLVLVHAMFPPDRAGGLAIGDLRVIAGFVVAKLSCLAWYFQVKYSRCSSALTSRSFAYSMNMGAAIALADVGVTACFGLGIYSLCSVPSVDSIMDSNAAIELLVVFACVWLLFVGSFPLLRFFVRRALQ